MVYLEAFSKVLPVLLLIGLGALLRRFGFLSEAAIHGFKQLVVNITLPAALFLAFAGVTLEGGHLVVVALIFLLCLLALWASRLRRPMAGIDSDYLPPLVTGFEAGMMYGLRDLRRRLWHGQHLSVCRDRSRPGAVCFFILVPYVQRLSVGPAPFTHTLRSFLRTPVILSILLGILFNQLGLAGR